MLRFASTLCKYGTRTRSEGDHLDIYVTLINMSDLFLDYGQEPEPKVSWSLLRLHLHPDSDSCICTEDPDI